MDKQYKRNNKILYWRLRLSIELDKALSQREFGEIVNCSRYSISRWESDEINAEPDLESARKIVKGLKQYFPDITLDDVTPP